MTTSKRLVSSALALSLGLGIMCSCSDDGLPALDMNVQHSDIYVERNEAVGDDFIMGVDVSSYFSEIESGVTYYDFDGNVLDNQGFFNLLAECGVTHVRIRIWNDPYDSSGRTFGGGHNDADTAALIANLAGNAGLKVILDFHYSDFWADPSKQMVPREWSDMNLEQRGDALYDFTYHTLGYIADQGADIDIVQIGNETTNGFCGYEDWPSMTSLMQRGSEAVRDFDGSIRIAMHFANPERENAYSFYADQLNTYGVDYDIFASSYYPYWHGSTENLTEVLSYVAETYGKQVMVMECSWSYTLQDGDGFPNTIGEGSDGIENYRISPQGQADMLSAVTRAVTDVGSAGIGICYWEPAWIPVEVACREDGTIDNAIAESNMILWNRNGSGWASVFADEYDPDDAGVYYGGSAVDNQALFDFEGHPLESLRTFHFIRTGTDAPVPEATSTPTPTPVPVTAEGEVVVNGGFEDGLNDWEITGFNTEDASSNARTGSGSLHFYSADGSDDFTAVQLIDLEPGTYEFSAWVEGGDSGDSDQIGVDITVNGTIYDGHSSVTGWQQWSQIVISDIEITEPTTVSICIYVHNPTPGAWGAFDDVSMVPS